VPRHVLDCVGNQPGRGGRVSMRSMCGSAGMRWVARRYRKGRNDLIIGIGGR
jgi:hypothetical protein